MGDRLGNDKKRFKSQENDLDCTNAKRGVWLVKVPKYISSKWQKAAPQSEVGRLKITKLPNGKPDIKLTLTNDSINSDPDGNVSIPTEHQLALSNITHQTLGVFSSVVGGENGESTEPNKLTLEGHVVEKGECRPVADQKYMNLKRVTIVKAQEPERTIKQLRKVIQPYKPVNTHRHLVEYEQKKKVEGKKAREDKDKVLDMLFAAFEKHQYYNIKDLEKVTKQPVSYLKEILKEICNYNAKSPHKNMWELKPEYRFYHKQEGEEEAAAK